MDIRYFIVIPLLNQKGKLAYMTINLAHLNEIDRIKDTSTLFDIRSILTIMVNSGFERGLSFSEIKTLSRMSDTRARPSLLLLNALNYITISDKIGNVVLYKINTKGINLLHDMEGFYENQHC